MAGTAPSKALLADQEAEVAIQQHQLQVAALYEQLNEWSKAEAAYLEAASGLSEDLAGRALEGIKRVHQRARGREVSPSLELGAVYERLGMWTEAEAHYAAAATEPSAQVQKRALKGLERVRERRPRSRAVEYVQALRQEFGFWSSLLLTLFGAVGILALLLLLVLPLSLQLRRRIEVLPFVGGDDRARAALAYWFGEVGAKLRAPSTPSYSPASISPLFLYVHLPTLPDPLVDLGEITLAGIKVRLSELLKGVIRPRLRISVGWTSTGFGSRLYAGIERRSGLVGFAPVGSIHREVRQSREAAELELFIYHVFIKAAESYAS